MHKPFPLLRLRLLLWSGSLFRSFRGNPVKPLVLGITGLGFLVLETVVFHRIFYVLFHELGAALQPVAEALSLYLLQTLFLIFGLMLVYSNLVTAISVYLTAGDMRLLLVLPVRNGSLFMYKFAETLSRSSLTLGVFMVPALVTYAQARGAGPEFYAWLPVLLLAFLLIPASVAVPVSLILARFFPAKRLQQGLLALGLVATTAGLFAFRMMKIEAVFQMTGSFSEMAAWADSFAFPQASWLPSTWLVRSLNGLVVEGTLSGESLLLAGVSLGSLLLSWGVGTPVLRTAWSKAFGSPRRSYGSSQRFRFGRFRIPGMGRADSAMVLKEVKVFARDLSRWSQLVMMVPLVGFYVLNMYMLPFVAQFSALYYLLNLFMIAFIVAAIGARYLFPSVSWEGPAMWLVRVSPYPVWRLVVIKFILFSLPLLVLTSVLVVFSHRLFGFEPEVLPVSLVLALETAVFLSALAVGFGAMLPKFRYEHHLEISLGPGGLTYMLTAFGVSFAFVQFLALPIFAAMGQDAYHWERWTFSNLVLPNRDHRVLWLLFCLAGAAASLGWGIRSLSKREDFDR